MGDITEAKVIPVPEENMLPSLAPIPKEIARGLNYVCKNLRFYIYLCNICYI